MSDSTKSSSTSDKDSKTVEEAVLVESSTEQGESSTKQEESSTKQEESSTKQEKSSTEQEVSSTEQAAKSSKSGALWFVTLLNLILIIALCGLAYWYYSQLSQDDNEEKSAFDEIQQSLSDSQDAQNQTKQTLKREIEQLNKRLDEQTDNNQSRFNQSLNNLSQQIVANKESNQAIAKRLAELSGRRPSDWLLAEANYLVNLAGRKLYLEKDIRTAMTLLKEADARIEDLNDPALFPIRADIAGDLQALSQIDPASTTSIALAISGMLKEVDSLTLDTLQLPESSDEEDLSLSEDVSDWRQNLARTWKSIVGDFFTIDYTDKPLEPYLAERQQWLISQQVKHALAQAQTAVLAEQQALYLASLEHALSLLIEHYNSEDTGVRRFTNTLRELKDADFTQNLPQKLAAQESLKYIINQRIEGLYNNQSNTLNESNSANSDKNEDPEL